MSDKKSTRDNKYDTTKKTRRTFIGGQALLEGVMMRGATSVAMAVRAPDGEIELETQRLKKPSRARKIPVVRGVISFVDSLAVGMRSTLRSAEISSPEDETPSKASTSVAVIIGVLLAVALFVALPWFIGYALERWAHVGIAVKSVAEGGARLVIFIAYLALVRLMRDIKRTFMYHGAEHRTINCYERGLPLTVENVQSCSTKHNRCGTTFLFFVVLFAIIVYALLNYVLSLFPDLEWLFGNALFSLALRLCLLPIIAGLSFELLRGLAIMPDNKFTNAIRAPGLALQKLTTALPDDDMAEVAIVAFNAVLELDADPNKPTISFYERDFKKERKMLAERLADNPQDADWIYCELLGKSRAELDGVRFVKIGLVKQANEYADRLLAGEPLDYVLGNSDFCGIKLKVDKRVLIPRFETEVLAAEAVKLIVKLDSARAAENIGAEKSDESGKETAEKTDASGKETNVKILDLCTGSGCIAAYIARNTAAEVVASDISSDCLDVARDNLKGLGVELVQSDMFENVAGEFDLIVTNPPYVRTFDIDGLAPEVKAQPRRALDGGEDGLRFYRIIAEQAPKHLKPHGVIMAEVGYDQAEQVIELFGAIGKCRIIKDLDGKDRIVVCEK